MNWPKPRPPRTLVVPAIVAKWPAPPSLLEQSPVARAVKAWWGRQTPRHKQLKSIAGIAFLLFVVFLSVMLHSNWTLLTGDSGPRPAPSRATTGWPVGGTWRCGSIRSKLRGRR